LRLTAASLTARSARKARNAPGNSFGDMCRIACATPARYHAMISASAPAARSATSAAIASSNPPSGSRVLVVGRLRFA
jgi:hypothetical protein